ncbi:MAG: UTP--glucose-1-phosphate uridylyltransferase GalU [Deltaproteobacteria bacterium]|jgi:UTP--glucose-1-phosphate uridylyltransferase|nr:UTP--glucose-1-phosphate uridylyltransferase GalU [Deltaproteobacteria bacterium]
MNIRKVVIPVAGWGTRSLPASKNIPKEMLPIYNKPVVQYVVEEAIKAGVKDVVFITNKDKHAIEDHFDYNLQLEAVLERGGKKDLLAVVHAVAEMVNIISIRQKKQLGLGHAVLCARDVVRFDEAFGICVGDDLMFGEHTGLSQLLDVARKRGMPCIGVMEVPKNKVHRYGIVAGVEEEPGVWRITEMVEKPPVEKAPSNLAIVGRYILTPDIFEYLETAQPGVGGEIQLTDAMARLAADKGMLAVKMTGTRFDAGDWVEYLTANIYFGLHDPEIRDSLLAKLRTVMEYAASQTGV